MKNEKPLNPLPVIQGALFEEDIQGDFMGSSRIRIFPITSDTMEPTYRRGNFVLVIPADNFRGEGVYILESHGIPQIYRVCRYGRDDARLSQDHEVLRRHPHVLPMDRFNDGVIGFVVGSIAISDPQALNAALAD